MQKSVPYSKAFAARPPREVVIGIAKDVQGKYNPIALGMFTHVANEPPVPVLLQVTTRPEVETGLPYVSVSWALIVTAVPAIGL